MSLLGSALRQRKGADPLQSWIDVMYGQQRQSKAGVSITLDNALRVSTMFACLRKIANGCSQVPFRLYRNNNGMREVDSGHYLHDLISVAPNSWTTSYEFMETLVIHAGLGNAYVFLNRGINGKILEMIILKPSRVEKKVDNYKVTYEVTGDSGIKQVLPADAIWHVRGPSWDGLLGLDIVSLAREALGLSISTEEAHARLHAKGVSPSGTYSVEGVMSPEKYRQLKDWIMSEYAGADNYGMPMILDNGAKWVSTAMKGVDAQHLETRKYQVEEVCRFMDVMPIMVGLSDKSATYASAEQMFIAHVVHTLMPWYKRIENSAELNLLSKAQRREGRYFKFNANALLRGAAKDRAEYYSKALGSGGSPAWITQDEVRDLEEMNPFGGSASILPERLGGNNNGT